ncbi:MAG: ABC transporter permease subunit [Rhodospirillales bacterium]|nr:ABC transporter permease subunit [Rhodospirillales bacterium]
MAEPGAGPSPSPWQRAWRRAGVRRAAILLGLAALWQGYALHLNDRLLFPTFSATLAALWAGVASGEILARAWFSIHVLLLGYAAGIALAALLVLLALGSQLGADLLQTLTAMLNPLPAIALLPLALIWFGLGNASLIFVLVDSVLWSVALNTHAGFLAVSRTVRKVGRNYGLSGPRYVFRILVPAALPSILTGLRIGWAFAWRTMIASELVFGVSSGSGGLGWYIYENKSELNISAVFAGLFTVILIGLVVEHGVFETVERRTVRRWGMQH